MSRYQQIARRMIDQQLQESIPPEWEDLNDKYATGWLWVNHYKRSKAMEYMREAARRLEPDAPQGADITELQSWLIDYEEFLTLGALMRDLALRKGGFKRRNREWEIQTTERDFFEWITSDAYDTAREHLAQAILDIREKRAK